MAELGVTAPYEIALRIAEVGAWDGAPASNAYQPYAVMSESMTRNVEERDADVMDGLISMRDVNRRQGKKSAEGSITCYLRPNTWLALLKFCFGALSGGNPAFVQGSELQLFHVEVDKGAGNFRFSNCRVARWTLRSTQDDGHLTLTMEVVGSDGTPGIALTATTATLATGPIIQHYELAAAINGTTVEPKSFEVSVDHNLNTNIYRNSQVRRALKRGGKRRISGVFELDNNTANLALLTDWQNDTPFGWQCVWTNGDDTLTLKSHTPASAGARFLGEVPTTNAGDAEVPLRLPFKGVASATSDDELVCVIAS